MNDEFNMYNHFNNLTFAMGNSSNVFDSNATFNSFSRRESMLSQRDSLPHQNKSIRIRNETYSIERNEEEDEQPLLEELEIYPEKIMDKAMIILNPMRQSRWECEQFLMEIDLPGPIFICLLFGCLIVLNGRQVTFHHVYILSLMSVIGLYLLLNLLEYNNAMKLATLKSVASVLGYGLLHTLWLGACGFLIQLNSFNGYVLVAASIFCSTLSASRILSIVIKQHNNIELFAYPIALIYCIFTLFIIF